MKTPDGQYRDYKSVNAFQWRRRALLLLASLVFCILPNALADDHYAARNGQPPGGDCSTWEKASSNIQDAVNAATTNDTVWVGAGRYTVPPNATNYWGTNVVFINRPLTMRSSNSVPETTIIDGQGSNRGVAVYYMRTTTNRFVIDGFTISNCFATNNGGGILFSYYDGTTYFPWTGAVYNCALLNNVASLGSGGGLYAGWSFNQFVMTTVSNCVFRGNQALLGSGGGIYRGGFGQIDITGCLIESNTTMIGGGALLGWAAVRIDKCIIRGNRATDGAAESGGGGLWLSQIGAGANPVTSWLRNCLIYDNVSGVYGGGILLNNKEVLYIYNCTIVSNRHGTTGGGGIWVRRTGEGAGFRANNSIIYSNYNNLDVGADIYTNIVCINSCIYSTNNLNAVGNTGNITNPPAFVNFAGQNYRLSRASPCINSGLNQAWMEGAKDLEGSPRVDRFSGRVDMGCYEHLSRGMMFKAR